MVRLDDALGQQLAVHRWAVFISSFYSPPESEGLFGLRPVAGATGSQTGRLPVR